MVQLHTSSEHTSLLQQHLAISSSWQMRNKELELPKTTAMEISSQFQEKAKKSLSISPLDWHLSHLKEDKKKIPFPFP